MSFALVLLVVAAGPAFAELSCSESVDYFKAIQCVEERTSAACTARARCEWKASPANAAVGYCMYKQVDADLGSMCNNSKCVVEGLGADTFERQVALRRLDFWCSKDEQDRYYMPDNFANCPCVFSDFTNLHFLSKMLIDKFNIANYAGLCETSYTKLVAFRRNSVRLAALLVRLWAVKKATLCAANPSSAECSSATEVAASYAKRQQLTHAMLAGMCQRKEGASGGDYCLARIVAQADAEFTTCFVGLATGSAATCSEACDRKLSSVLPGWGCCLATLQQHFEGLVGNGLFLKNLRICPSKNYTTNETLSETLNETLSDEALGSGSMCAAVTSKQSLTKTLHLRIAYSKLSAAQRDALKAALAQDMAALMAVPPAWVTAGQLQEDAGLSFEVASATVRGTQFSFTVKAARDVEVEGSDALFASQLSLSSFASAAEALEGCSDCAAGAKDWLARVADDPATPSRARGPPCLALSLAAATFSLACLV